MTLGSMILADDALKLSFFQVALTICCARSLHLRMNKLTCIVVCSISLFLISFFAQGQEISFEKDAEKNTTATYEELIAFYERLDQEYAEAKLMEIGKTDIGKPLHLFVLSKSGDFDPQTLKAQHKAVLLVNNGIHPGEPEGIDAGMMFARDLLASSGLPEDVVVAMIPVYNVAGMLNRGVSRVNQNGPKAYGFRGSAQNYDLNRDFIKTDTRNAELFQLIFNTWDPDVFFDTHASNGADYQYAMTLIATQKDKLASPLSDLMQRKFTAKMYQDMEDQGIPMIPYVDTKGETPESGLVDFLETPRYSTGYAAVHHTMGYMPETHMWKPYADRVKGTLTLLRSLMEAIVDNREELLRSRILAKRQSITQEEFVLTWKLDETKVDTIPFFGYASGHKPSTVTGYQRLFYDRSAPKTMNIPYYNTYVADIVVQKPKAYIIPQSYEKVIDLLKLNGVKIRTVEQDTVMLVEMYYINDYKTASRPYEGHYLHQNVVLEAREMEVVFHCGDVIVEMNQPHNRYVVETLEPQSPDSFFCWNFFDAILSQKEYFSDYIFEDFAAELLAKDDDLKRAFEEAKAKDTTLSSDGRAQLDWIYKRSPYYEKTHLRYPIGRMM